MTRAFYVKYLRKTLASLNRDEGHFLNTREPGFGDLAVQLSPIIRETQMELDRVLEEPDGGDYSPDLAEFNRRVLFPESK